MKKYKKSTYLPIVMLLYLAIMSYIGFAEFRNGNYLYYFGVIGGTLLVIILLHFSLKRRERLSKEREDDINSSSK